VDSAHLPPAHHSFPTRRSSDLAGLKFAITRGLGIPLLVGTDDLVEAGPPPSVHRRQWRVDSRSPACKTERHEETESASQTSQARSEEHTSELQSRVDLVCRLLL